MLLGGNILGGGGFNGFGFGSGGFGNGYSGFSSNGVGGYGGTNFGFNPFNVLSQLTGGALHGAGNTIGGYSGNSNFQLNGLDSYGGGGGWPKIGLGGNNWGSSSSSWSSGRYNNSQYNSNYNSSYYGYQSQSDNGGFLGSMQRSGHEFASGHIFSGLKEAFLAPLHGIQHALHGNGCTVQNSNYAQAPTAYAANSGSRQSTHFFS